MRLASQGRDLLLRHAHFKLATHLASGDASSHQKSRDAGNRNSSGHAEPLNEESQSKAAPNLNVVLNFPFWRQTVPQADGDPG